MPLPHEPDNAHEPAYTSTTEHEREPHSNTTNTTGDGEVLQDGGAGGIAGRVRRRTGRRVVELCLYLYLYYAMENLYLL